MRDKDSKLLWEAYSEQPPGPDPYDDPDVLSPESIRNLLEPQGFTRTKYHEGRRFEQYKRGMILVYVHPNEDPPGVIVVNYSSQDNHFFKLGVDRIADLNAVIPKKTKAEKEEEELRAQVAKWDAEEGI